MSYLKAVAILAVVIGFWVATERAWRAVFGDGGARRLGCGGCAGCGNRCSGGLEQKER
jgi:hypothetical protein